MKPGLIIQGKFYPKDINVKIADSSNRKINFEIENKIDDNWKEYEKTKKKNGGMIWDATTYRLEDLKKDGDKIELFLGEINFSKRIGARGCLKELAVLGKDYYPAGIYLAAIIKTNDGHYVIGELSGKTTVEGEVSLIGGLLSKDEMLIKSSVDISEMLQKELEEEIYIESNEIKDIYLKAIIQTERLAFGLIFYVNLNISAENIKYKFVPNDEIAGIKFCSKKEIVNILKSMGGARELIAGLI